MASKPKKSTTELSALITDEIRKHPECDNITGVGFTRPLQRTPHEPNWAPAWTANSPKLAPLIAYEVAWKLQNQFDLI
jgi:hypothetical protein